MLTATMNTSRALGLALAGALLCTGLAFAGSPLSTEVARLIESHGVEGARARFAELWANNADGFEPDPEALADLGTRYLQEGDIEAGMAVMEMVSIISLAELDAALQSQAALVAEMEAAAAAIAAETAPAAAPEAADEQPPAGDRRVDPGPAREDLERLSGVYASDGEPGRELFVTRTCDGYLVAGPMWADTAPWQLQSESREAFTFQQGDLHFRLEFATSGDGAAQQLSHSIRGLASPMQRRGPLQGSWPDCQPTATEAP